MPEILESVVEEDEAVAMSVDEVPLERIEEAPKEKAKRGARKTRTQRKARKAETAAEIGRGEARSPPETRTKRLTRASKRKQEEASVSISTVDVIEEEVMSVQKEETEIQPVTSKPRRGRPPKNGTKPKPTLPPKDGQIERNRNGESINQKTTNCIYLMTYLQSRKICLL